MSEKYLTAYNNALTDEQLQSIIDKDAQPLIVEIIKMLDDTKEDAAFVFEQVIMSLNQPLNHVNSIDDLRKEAAKYETASDFFDDVQFKTSSKYSVYSALSSAAYYLTHFDSLKEPFDAYALIWNEAIEEGFGG